jgi:predicted TPR repeat methyltransferase
MSPDLLPILKEASRALSCGGLLAFTLESHDGDGFVMGEGRRYAHGACYVRTSLEAAGLAALQFEPQSIRTERGVPVPGLVIVAAKP